ncbi:DUF2510 domain-containing protein [Actinomadura logoneensis]|uniref:DUF2510 domain-containing protein n=1 Tax=Actinomadura logoneensis TaxID=2293572 RepID=A0A372J9Y4_9ACTN|nr:DUF2510 domain-containing protein [Actinomadura logoneensis]RFU36835.1 DUF2510 domain-containing protein [Actinomadura logoneensis]
MSQPGWYADPYGGGGLRWWDGNVWTEHARPAPPPPPAPPVAMAPPAPAAPAPAPAVPAQPVPSQPVVAGPVFNLEYRKFHVWADQHTLGVNGRTIPIADIRWVSHWVVRKVQGSSGLNDPTRGNFEYHFKAGTDPSRSRGDVRAEFYRRYKDKEDPEAWTALLRLLRERVEPDILARMDARLRRGQSIDFSRRAQVHPGGVVVGRDSFAWTQVQSAKDHAGRVWLFVHGREKPLPVAVHSTPNAGLITPLVNMNVARQRG